MSEDKTLEDNFAQMRREDIGASEALMDRVMMDADSVLAGSANPEGSGSDMSGASTLGFGTRILDLIGGWPSFGGLAAATVAGLWIGVSPPAALSDISAAYLGSTVEVPVFETDIYAGLEF